MPMLLPPPPHPNPTTTLSSPPSFGPPPSALLAARSPPFPPLAPRCRRRRRRRPTTTTGRGRRWATTRTAAMGGRWATARRSTGTRGTWRRAARRTTGTSATTRSAPSSAASRRRRPGSLWSAAAPRVRNLLPSSTLLYPSYYHPISSSTGNSRRAELPLRRCFAFFYMFPKVESSVMSEDMVNDGYVEIVNIDISSVVIEMMRKKYFNVPQLQYLRMDVRDMSMFRDESFDCAIDKGTLDSLMCGVDAPLSAAQMILEVDRLLKPGGVFILITYGDPSVRVPHLNQSACDWKIVLYILPRPGFIEKIRRRVLDPVPLTERGRLPDGFVPEDPDSHYVYVCKKMQGLTGTGSPTVNHIESQGEE